MVFQAKEEIEEDEDDAPVFTIIRSSTTVNPNEHSAQNSGGVKGKAAKNKQKKNKRSKAMAPAEESDQSSKLNTFMRNISG